MQGAQTTHWSEYLDLLRWLIPDVYRHARGKLIGMLLLSAIGVGLRAASAAVIVLFVDAQQKGQGPELLGIVLPAQPTPLNLMLWGSAGLLFAGGAVWASYSCDRLIYGLARTYVEDRSRRVLRFIAAGGVVRSGEGDARTGSKSSARLIAGSSLQLVRVVIAALSIVLPAITGIAAIAVLFATQALLTAFLVPIGIGYAVLLGRIQRQTLRDVERRIEAHRNSRGDSARMLQILERQRFPAGGEPRWLLDYPDRSWLARSLDAYRSTVFAKRRIGYLGELFQAAALLLILLVFGSLIATEGASWTVLMTYAVSLGYAVRSLVSASGFVTAVNRALPKVRRYLTFLRLNPVLVRKLDEGTALPSDAEHALEVSAPGLPGGQGRVVLRAGEPVLCVHPRPLANASLEGFCRALANGDARRAALFERELFTVQGLGGLPERRVLEHLPPHAEDEAQWRAAREVLEALGVSAEFDAAIGDPTRALASTDDERLGPALRLGLRLLPGLLSSRGIVALDHETVERLDPQARSRLFEVLSSRILLLTAVGAPKGLVPELGAAIVVDLEAVRGIGDVPWFDTVARPAVADWGVALASVDEVDDGTVFDDDSEDDE